MQQFQEVFHFISRVSLREGGREGGTDRGREGGTDGGTEGGGYGVVLKILHKSLLN